MIRRCEICKRRVYEIGGVPLSINLTTGVDGAMYTYSCSMNEDLTEELQPNIDPPIDQGIHKKTTRKLFNEALI